MKKILVALSFICLFSCQNDRKMMKVEGTIDGLKKGTIYFQKIERDTFVTIDSVVAEGNGNFVFKQKLESPELFYIQLDKKDGNKLNDQISFFGTPGVINIKTQVDFFDLNAKIEGSEVQKDFEKYNEMIRQFNNKNLDLLQAQIKAVKTKDGQRADSINVLAERNNLRKYLFTINYALNHKDSYITPYVTLRDAYNANTKYLDSIYGLLSDEVANTKYGKQLKEYIAELKDTTKIN